MPILTEWEEKSAIAIASNEPFSRLDQDLHRHRLCAAVVDGLTFDGQIIEASATSYRLVHDRS